MRKIIPFLFYLLLLGCEQETFIQSFPRVSAEEIYGFWRYEYGIGEESFEEYPLAYIDIAQDGSFSGFTSRNRIGGKVEKTGTEGISFDIQFSTYAADTPWSGDFVQILNESESYTIDDNRLMIYAKDRKGPLVFRYILSDACFPIKIDRDQFNSGSSDPFELLDVKIVNSCLEVRIAYGGGNGDIAMELLTSGDYAESLPPQLDARLFFYDNDPGEAILPALFYFDLSTIQYQELNELILHLDAWKEEILIRYPD